MTDEKDYSDIRLFVAVPSTDMVHADFAMCLAAMSNHNTSFKIRMALQNLKSADIARARNEQVKAAIKQKATHILFVDSDMVFKPWAAQVLIDTQIREGHKIIGVSVPRRRAPFQQVSFEKDGSQLKIEMDDARGLVECSKFGTGMVLIDLSVFDEVAFPWFDSHYDGEDRISEDVDFFRKSAAAGHPPYCHVPLSMDTQHIGQVQFDYTSEDFYADAHALRAQKANELMAEHIQKEQKKVANDG